ncbi:type II secretion system minor pseudopilin GspI [Amphiplicatus metriothermophilus]|uniref:Type II secretion system protein I n=1 Tax=Amphiplicatus metriothermophilus TaxID=1519374 RepID=A0A239PP56_9PROT|nr:type II secretion system minor pseudopilin GspI [Amphiplicatus metriothermophilus]MBB5518756.1 type II secretion system protein I [Amphiplicatus metriothermophilus]SNT72089.1 type II secretion system protein I (GspI) [Amphiplicatus metriothermophilus]
MTVRDADSQKGFTLIEALVALVALGLVVGGALALIAQNARFIAAAEDRLVAQALADNLMVEALAASAPLEREVTSGETSFAGRDLRWRRVVVETGVDDVVRIDIDVRRRKVGQTLAAATSLKRERS